MVPRANSIWNRVRDQQRKGESKDDGMKSVVSCSRGTGVLAFHTKKEGGRRMSVSFQNEFLIRKQHPEGGLSRKVPPTYSFLSKYYRSSPSYKYSTTSNSCIASPYDPMW